jgi:3-deoxy-7-phosphoheptulonate synthase
MSQDLPTFIVRLADTGPRAVQRVLGRCGIHGPSPSWRRHAQNLLTVRASDAGNDLCARLAEDPAVERVVALAGSRLYARWPNGKPGPLCLRNGATFGSEPVVIAGPCSVEGREQVLEIARAVLAAGAQALRGGVFKPRTSPYDFGGLGEAGLPLLVEAAQATGLPFVTEALDTTVLDLVATHADVVQLGSRNMHNSSLLFAAGAHPLGKPILLKRGLGATLDELLEAAEYVLLGRLAAGHVEPGLILCERGIRAFETSTRFTLDVAAIPVLARRTHLPVVVDPSHAAGDRDLVHALAAAAIAAGAHGLLVEVHRDPPRAWCDGAQSLALPEFEELIEIVRQLRGEQAAC